MSAEPDFSVKPPAIYAAYGAVMDEVQAIGKTQRNESQNYSFRGVDAVINAVGPKLREHGIGVAPRVISQSHRDFLSDRGKTQHEAIVEMGYTLFSTVDGSHLPEMSACGEASDFSDKATSQAESVAYRTLWIQALCIPTGMPDPDESGVVRGGIDTPANETVIGQLKRDLDSLPDALRFRTIVKTAFVRMFGAPDELTANQQVAAVEYVAAMTAIASARAEAVAPEAAVSEPREPSSPAPEPTTAPPAQNGSQAAEAINWSAEAKSMGLTATDVLKQARLAAKEAGMVEPIKMAEIHDALAPDLFAKLAALAEKKGKEVKS